jgi:hypothetical protein
MGRDSMSKGAVRVGTVLLIVLMSCNNSSAYSVLTHEEIVEPAPTVTSTPAQ